MKKCRYCGRVNEDDAVRCSGCGTTEFRLEADAQATSPGNRLGVAAVCDRCGATTDVAQTFVRDIFSGDTLCPPCVQKRRTRAFIGLLVLYVGLAGIGYLFIRSEITRPLGSSIFNLCLFQLSLVLAIPLHEYAHALAAARMGWRVFGVYLGFGRTVFKTSLFGFQTEVRMALIGGFVLAAPRDPAHFRIKSFIFASAGITANIVWILGCFLAVQLSHRGFGGLTSRVDFFQMSLFANAFIVIINLWPYRVITPGKIPSDGLQMIQALRTNEKSRADAHAAWFVGEGGVCYSQQEYQAARSWFERGIQLYPENVHLLVAQGTALLMLKEFNKAREAFEAVLSRVQNDQVTRVLVLNNIAYTDVLLAENDLLEEADRFSAEASATLGWLPAIKGTRGAALLLMGKVDDALPLLREAMQKNELAANRAQNACWLAMAHAALGDSVSGNKLLHEATKLDPSCFLLERARLACQNCRELQKAAAPGNQS